MSSKVINLGDLKLLIEIQRNTITTDSYGFQQEEWTTICKTRAKTEFDDRLMKEIFKDDGIDTTIVKIFTFRYFRGLTVKDRILFNGQTYEIYGINNINDENRFYKVWARAIWQ